MDAAWLAAGAVAAYYGASVLASRTIALQRSARISANAITAMAGTGRVIITSEGFRHVLERHTYSGIARFATKSKFYSGIDIRKLIQLSASHRAVPQVNGNFQRVVDAGRNIGIDRNTGKPTSIYSVITNAAGELVTAFPGVP